MRKFLTAKWHDLVMANYEVAPEILAGRLPNRAFRSIFLKANVLFPSSRLCFWTRVFSAVPVPFHINFEEANLRFYVKRESAEEMRRGVTFIKEIVPRFAIATVARVFYGEPYEAWKMSHAKQENELIYAWWKRSGDAHSVKIETGENTGVPAENSQGEFIIEHYWGYTKRGANRTDEYRVEHPKWELFDVKNYEIKIDFGKLYGEEFSFFK